MVLNMRGRLSTPPLHMGVHFEPSIAAREGARKLPPKAYVPRREGTRRALPFVFSAFSRTPVALVGGGGGAVKASSSRSNAEAAAPSFQPRRIMTGLGPAASGVSSHFSSDSSCVVSSLAGWWPTPHTISTTAEIAPDRAADRARVISLVLRAAPCSSWGIAIASRMHIARAISGSGKLQLRRSPRNSMAMGTSSTP